MQRNLKLEPRRLHDLQSCASFYLFLLLITPGANKLDATPSTSEVKSTGESPNGIMISEEERHSILNQQVDAVAVYE